MRTTEGLRTEHHLLRVLFEAMSGWLTSGSSPTTLRERAVVIAVALEDHARREEQSVLDPLRSRSESARHLVDRMELVHDEVRGLFEEIADPALDPRPRLWTVLQLTEKHFVKEEEEVFPLADTLKASNPDPRQRGQQP